MAASTALPPERNRVAPISLAIELGLVTIPEGPNAFERGGEDSSWERLEVKILGCGVRQAHTKRPCKIYTLNFKPLEPINHNII